MPSLLPDFEYDVFISYRQNDNRSGWVTEFVNHLNEELAATIKRPVSVYFDSNAHDGLLETHNVARSLEGKLKCLIFIPIVSQTYCDTDSFAWQHEFCAFNKLAAADQFGRDIKLHNGNVASRILAVKIHELDADDKTTIEKETGGPLRAIEFMFKSGGVNRPLNSKDDELRTPGKILYRDQVNKVANAIKEIDAALRTPHSHDAEKRHHDQTPPRPARNRKPLIAAAAILVLILLGYFSYEKLTASNVQSSQPGKSIAVLPFVDMSPAKDQEYLADGIAEEIITALSHIKELKVIGRTSSFQFKGEKVDLRDVGEQLNVSTVLEGSIMKSGNKVRITAQLINVSDGAHIWSERFDKNIEDIFAIQDQISRAISDKMKISLLAQLPQRDERRTSNTEAYENYLRGQQVLHPGTGQLAIPFFEKATQLDSNYADAYAGLARAHYLNWLADRSEKFDIILQLARKVLELDPASEKSHELLYSYYNNYQWDWKLAEEEYQKYLAIKPVPFVGHALHLADVMGDVNGGIEELKIILDTDPIDKTILRLIGRLYALDHQYEKSKEMINKAIEIDPYFALSYRTLAGVDIEEGDYTSALENLRKTEELDAELPTALSRIWALTKANRLTEAQELYTSEISTWRTTAAYSPAALARIEFWMGHLDEGFRLLEEGLVKKDYEILTLRYSPQVDGMRDEPRFKEFLKKVPFPPDN